MTVTFQSIQSGSSGNCALVQSGDTALLVDAGFSSQRACRHMLEHVLPRLDGVIVSHLHGDHISYSALRVLEAHRVPVYVYEGDLETLRYRHFRGRAFDGLRIQPFTEQSFHVGGFAVRPFPVPHFGPFSTFGFELRRDAAAGPVRLVVATDLWDWSDVQGWFHDAHFIYVESNHDPAMLLQNPNPNSMFHLLNEKCGWLLRRAFDRSEVLPVAVMLGHLSQERNEPEIARETIHGILSEGGYGHVPIHVAPRLSASEAVRVSRGG